MSDRLFTDCCYGTEHQHGPNEACPYEQAVTQAIAEFNATAGFEDFYGHKSRIYARRPILATDCDYEIVRISGVEGRRMAQ